MNADIPPSPTETSAPGPAPSWPDGDVLAEDAARDGAEHWRAPLSAMPMDRLGEPRPADPAPVLPPSRGKLLLGPAIGLLAGLLLFGTAGFFVGRGHAPAAAARVSRQPTPEPSVVAALVANNRAKFSGELREPAEPWLADLSGCLDDHDQSGPKLAPGEQQHVLCRDGSLYVHFVTYSSADEKESDRGYREQLALGTSAILAGSEQPGRKLGGRTGAPGTYVEYATAPAHSAALCGIWWDRDNTASAVYSDALCDSLGGTWDPLRAVWQQHS
jgi:hypothetical protein